jgi:multidrug resistance protein, MATE family
MSAVLQPDQHPFFTRPHHTLITLSIPVVVASITEPITGLVDSAYLAQLGSVPVAALGIGTMVLSTFFWMFAFLAIGAQTEVSQNLGRQNHAEAVRISSLALILSTLFGVLLAFGIPFADRISALMGASGAVLTDTTIYIQTRLLGAPAVLILMTGSGAMRGIQDMRTPLLIALVVNICNIVLDPLMIFGWQWIPPLGVAGAGYATTISQWIGAVWILIAVRRRLGWTWAVNVREALQLMAVGRDVFIRTGLLTGYLLILTRISNQISVEAGAAHTVIRQLWLFVAFVVEGFGVTAQSLVGYFIGARLTPAARQVALYAARWSFGTGIALGITMLLTTSLVTDAFLPAAAVSVFVPAWIVAAFVQPINALAFTTDGIHWGTGDYRYLRDSMLLVTIIAGVLLLQVDINAENAFMWAWTVTAVWMVMRATAGMIRIWPGVGSSPLRTDAALAVIGTAKG